MGEGISKEKNHWKDFVKYKRSEEAQATSSQNSENAKKNVKPHRLGSGGYKGKIPVWEATIDRLVAAGKTIQTEGWNERSVRFLLGRGFTYNDGGSLCTPPPPLRTLLWI